LSTLAGSDPGLEDSSREGTEDFQVVPHRALEAHGRLHGERGAPAQVARIERADIAPVEAYDSAGRLDQTVETPQQCGLARSRGAEQDERAAALHRDRHVLEDGGRWLATEFLIDERELLDLEERIARRNGGGHAWASVASGLQVRQELGSSTPL